MSSGEGSAVARLLSGRVVVATVVLVSVGGAAVFRGIPFPLLPFSVVITGAYGFSLASLLVFRRLRGSVRFAVVQIAGDLLLETLLIYVTGGASSVFTFLYLLSIMAASRVLAPWRSVPTAAAAVLLHGTLLTLLLYDVVPPAARDPVKQDALFQASVSLLMILGNICASFLVAYVSAKFAERLQHVGQLAARSEADLADLRVLHEDIVQSVPSGLITLNRTGKVLTANRMAGTIAGLAPETLVGRSWQDLLIGIEPFGRVLADLEGGARSRRIEARLLRPGGAAVPLGLTVALLSQGEVSVGVICSFQDLTEIKRMEEQVRRGDRLAAAGALAAGLAHELRNPLLSVIGSIEVLQRSLNPQGTDRELMEIVLKESDRLNSILTEFLEYSRVQPVRRELCDVGEILREMVRLLSYDRRVSPDTKIVSDVEGETLSVPLDPKQIRQALWNLCTNAVDAMPCGGELALRARVRPSGVIGEGGLFDPCLEIRVADTGKGIPSGQIPHIFEPFYSTKPQGFGLGLAIVHRIVQEHGGQIDVESEDGKGTTFVLTIPVKDGE
jgi:two-component system sensor histidine kinase PilS (NtrC family)